VPGLSRARSALVLTGLLAALAGCGSGPATTRDGTTDSTIGDTPRGALADPTSPESAAEVINQYYAAIDAGDYHSAYTLWSNEGEASGKTYDEFAAGFQRTSQVEAMVGEPGRIGAAAGSRYVEIPVTLRAVTINGEEQHFSGHYVMRRSEVDGATPDQRRWRIYSAVMKAVP
jgi:hypothetical protein